MTREEYKKLLYEVLEEDYGEQYKTCKDCKKPTHKRYICSWCGSIDP